MINVTDRVPTRELANGALRYGVYDEQGNLLRYEYIKREDEPTNEGTPVNKVLFDSIKDDLIDNKGKVERVDRYSVPTITKETIDGQQVNLLSITKEGVTEYIENMRVMLRLPLTTEQIISNIIPAMESDNYQGFKTTASSSDYTRHPYGAVYSSGWWSSYINRTRTEWWQMELPFFVKNPTVQVSLKRVRDNKMYASRDGRNWQEFTYTSYSSPTFTFAISDNQFYKYFKFIGYSTVNQDQMNVASFSIMAGEKTIYDEGNETFLKINLLEPIQIYELSMLKILNELEYDGSSFINNVSQKTKIKVESGTITNGGNIPKPDGYSNVVYLGSINYTASNTNVNCSIDQLDGYVSSSGTVNYWTIAWND